jgi:uncharacterized protein (DUF1330 family)
MSAYLIANYNITNPEAYESYPQAAAATLQAYGAEMVVADFDTEAVEGEAGKVTIVIRFESRDALNNWYNSPEYQDVVNLRLDNSEGNMVFVDAFVAA